MKDIKGLKTGQLLPIIAGVCVLLALWFAFTGWQVWSANSVQKAVAEARKKVAGQVQPIISTLASKANSLSGRPDLAAALRSGNNDAARAIVMQAVPGTEEVDIAQVGFASAYADPEKFGYGKLGLLESAAAEGGTKIAVVKDGGGPRLGVAVPIVEGAQVLGVIYLREPLSEISKLAENAAPKGGYLALRQGTYNVFENGASDTLRTRPEVSPEQISGTPMRVVSMAPEAEPGKFGMGGLGEFGLAGLLLAVAGGLVWQSKRAAKAPVAKPVEAEEVPDAPPTLAEIQSKAPAPEAKKPVMSTAQQAAMAGIALDRSIFRAYDIRGLVGVTLDANIARLIGQAIGSLMHEKNQRVIVVGRDGRLSSNSMSAGLIEGLRKAGREVIDIGEVPTPMAYFGSFHLRTGCCVEVTGSHNPPDYNGFKIVVDGETLSGDTIQNLYGRIAENRLHRAEALGALSSRDIKNDYIQRIADDIQIERKLKVVIDCGSGVAGAIAPDLLAAIGADVEPLYCDVDGMFPHHHPDPSDPMNLVDLIQMV